MNNDSKTILIIDKNKTIGNSLYETLNKDHKLLYFNTIEFVIPMLEKEDIALCIILSEKSNEELLDWLKRFARDYPYIPVIILTNQPDELAKAIQSSVYGVFHVFPKSIDPVALLQHVELCLNEDGIHFINKMLAKHKKKHHNTSLIHEKKTEREKRLLMILELIKKEPKKWTTGMIHRKFNVSQRQIQKDLKVLTDRGQPIKSHLKTLFIDEN